MRIGFVLLLAVSLGLFAGAATTVAEFGYPLEVTPKLDISALPLPAKGPPAVLAVKETTFDFGEVEKTAVPKHAFLVTNVGLGELTLSQGSGCGCTVSKVAVSGQQVTVTPTQPARVPPGESAEITLEWHLTNLGTGAQFRTFKIPTNDLKQPSLDLTLKGIVIENWKFNQQYVSFHDMSSKETRKATVNLLVYRGEKCEILGHKWSSPKGTEYIGVVYEELTPAELAEAAKPTPQAHPGAPPEKNPIPKSGYKLTFTARKGMPLGPIVETVTLDTNLKSPTPITLTTHGNVIGDISLLPHARLRQKPDLLFLGNVTRGKPQEVELQLRLVGEYRKNTRFTVKKVVPEELQVSFGEPTAGYGDLSMHVPMKVVLPAHAKPQAWLGTKPEQMGQILLETTNPDVKEFKILVQAAVVEPVSPAATN